MGIRQKLFWWFLVSATSWPLEAYPDEPLPRGLGNSTVSGLGQTFEPQQLRSLPLFSLERRGGFELSFESLGLLLPGASEDQLGISFGGASSLENTFYIDGIRVADTQYSALMMPLSVEFIDRVDIRLSGADATYGRGLGGVYDVGVRGGSQQWHLSTWTHVVPGALEGNRALVPFPERSIELQSRLSQASNLGFSLGGPLIPNRLFVFAGAQYAQRRLQLDRSLYALEWVMDPVIGPFRDLDAATGKQKKTRLPGMDEMFYATQRSGQWVGKFSYRPSPTRELSLSIVGAASASGGRGDHSFDLLTQQLNLTNLYGSYEALGRTESVIYNAAILRVSTVFPGGSTRFDAALGWVIGRAESGAADGSGVDDIGTPGTLAHAPSVLSRWGERSLADFEQLTPEAMNACSPSGDAFERSLQCSSGWYRTGGPAFLSKRVTNRLEGRAVLSTRFSALGEHRIRAGLDFELATLSYTTGYGGAVRLIESLTGSQVRNDSLGILQGTDDFAVLESSTNDGMSFDVGAFVSDTWSVTKNFVVEAAMRYDAQVIRGMAPGPDLILPDMISPRFGLSWAPMKKSWLTFRANYGLRYQSVPLDLAVRGMSAEPNVRHWHRVSGCALDESAKHYGGCTEEFVPIGDEAAKDHPHFLIYDRETKLAPSVHAPAAHQFSLSVDIEAPRNVRFNATYLRNDVIRALEDVYFGDGALILGNPGTSRATSAPQAVRTYDGLSFMATRPFANGFFVLASYNFSWLRGNYAGLFNPESGQIDPNVNSDFDTPLQNINRYRELAGDQRHAFKLYSGKTFTLPAGISLDIGGAYLARSGLPVQALGADGDSRYGSAVVYLDVPEVSMRTPTLHRFDMHAGVGVSLRKDMRLSASVDVFNVANSQTAVAVDQNYTYDEVTLDDAGQLAGPESVTMNRGYGYPTAYQAPRQVRLGLRLDY